MTKDLLQSFRDSPKRNRLFMREKLILDVTESIYEIMRRKSITKAEIARRLNVTPSAISQFLDGANLTLKRVADLFWAVGSEPVIACKTFYVEVDEAPIRIDTGSRRIPYAFDPVESTGGDDSQVIGPGNCAVAA